MARRKRRSQGLVTPPAGASETPPVAAIVSGTDSVPIHP
jgi:hypothetical protein